MGILADIGLGTERRNMLLEQTLKSEYEINRREEHRKRNEFYRDSGDRHVVRFIEDTFGSDLNKKLRKVFIKWAKGNNVTKRIVKEKSTVYKEEPTRKPDTPEFRLLQAETMMNLIMREADRMLSLHNDVLIGPRLRRDASRVLDIVTPDAMTPVTPPSDHTLALGWIIHQPPGKGADPREPHARLWCDDVSVLLDADGHQIGQPEDNPFGRIPFVHVADVPPSARGMLLDCESGRDVTATHESVWYQYVLLLKESKSSTRQTYFSGDTSTTPTGQAQESESDLLLGEGVTPGTLDRGTDQSQYRENSDFLLERCAGNHGIAPGILRHDGASSGFEIALRRIPIRELRQERIPIWRAGESRLVDLMGSVFGVRVSQDAFSIDFGEVETPQSPSERVDVFTKERTAGLVTTAEELQRRNPDLSEAQAYQLVFKKQKEESQRINSLNERMAGSFGALNKPKAAQEDDEGDGERFDA